MPEKSTADGKGKPQHDGDHYAGPIQFGNVGGRQNRNEVNNGAAESLREKAESLLPLVPTMDETQYYAAKSLLSRLKKEVDEVIKVKDELEAALETRKPDFP